MSYKGHSAYDDEDFFQQYLSKRQKGNAPNELIEKPIMDELVGDVSGKRVLDLGCGDGGYGKELLLRGASYYKGIEGSSNMYLLAEKNLRGHPAHIQHTTLEEWQGEETPFDLVVSRLVLHYIEELSSLFAHIHSSLGPNGCFVCSIEHPVITSSYEAYHQEGRRGNWIVDDYFHSGPRVNHWLGKEVIKYHRSLQDYWLLFQQAGFEIEELRESKPDPRFLTDEKEFLRRSRIPLFLILQGIKKDK
ncbi:MAG: class I SAM-dependent methyltransferase [Bacteroidota bacterium]